MKVDGRKKKLFTPEQDEYLRKVIPGRLVKEVTAMVNEKFGLSMIDTQIQSFKSRNNLVSGVGSQFKKGGTPWNKGKKMKFNVNSARTQFKKGQPPINHREVGSERTTRDGYVEIKIAEPNKWELKHRKVYKDHYGEIPEKHVVLFKNKNRSDVRIENLVLVSRSQLVVANKNDSLNVEDSLIETSLHIIDLRIAMSKRKRENKK